MQLIDLIRLSSYSPLFSTLQSSTLSSPHVSVGVGLQNLLSLRPPYFINSFPLPPVSYLSHLPLPRSLAHLSALPLSRPGGPFLPPTPTGRLSLRGRGRVRWLALMS